MESFYVSLLKKYLDNDYVRNTPIERVNPKYLEKYLPSEQIYIGPEAEGILIELPLTQKNLFKTHILSYYVTLCSGIRKKIDFGNSVTKNLNLLDPEYFMNSTKLLSINELIKSFPNISSRSKKIDIDAEYRQLQDLIEAKDILQDDVEKFWDRVANIRTSNGKLFPNLIEFVQMLLSLPHSSAEVERVFSKLALIKTKTRNRLNIKTAELQLS